MERVDSDNVVIYPLTRVRMMSIMMMMMMWQSLSRY
jgi:hypothetical protein